jgi:hypothetical protein
MKGKIALALVTTLGCRSEDGDLVVLVSSDFDVARELSTLRVSVSTPDGRGDADEIDLGRDGLPVSFAIAAGREPISIDVEGLSPAGDRLVARRADLIPGARGPALLAMFLSRACAGVTCPEGQSCGIDGCAPSDVFADMLPPVEPGRELEPSCPASARMCSGSRSVLVCGPSSVPLDIVACAEPATCDPSRQACSVPDPAGVPLDVILVGGPGRVVSSPPGIDCPRLSCRHEFELGTVVSLTAEGELGSTFAGFERDCSGPTCTIELSRPTMVDARFQIGATDRRLSIEFQGGGTGEVAVDGQHCRTGCDRYFAPGVVVNIDAVPDFGSVLEAVSGDCDSSPCQLSMTVDRTITIRFAPEGRPPPAYDFAHDLDGDGMSDLVFGAPGLSLGTEGSVGRVYVKRGPTSSAIGTAGDAEISYDGESGLDQLGYAILLPGDLDSDGHADLVVAAPGSDFARGAVYVVPGGPGLMGSGSIARARYVFSGEGDDRFGASLAAGDVDGDGDPDLIVGAPGMIPSGFGHAYVFFGGPGFFGRAAGGGDIVIDADLPGDQFGASLASGFDLDGDGFDDIAIGAPIHGDPGQGMAIGRVDVFRGRADIPRFLSSGSADFVRAGEVEGGALGFALAAGFDADGNGMGDLAAGAPGRDSVHVFLARPGYAGPFTPDRLEAGMGLFGFSLAAGRDITGDGVPDLVVGAPEDGGPSRGAAHIFEGRSNVRRVVFGSCFDEASCDAEGLGYTVGFAGDLDGDGLSDLAVGSRLGGGAMGSYDRGRIVVFRGGAFMSPQPSSIAPIQLVGEDQPGRCASLPGSPAWN